MVESDNTEVGPMSLNDTTDKNIKSNLRKPLEMSDLHFLNIPIRWNW